MLLNEIDPLMKKSLPPPQNPRFFRDEMLMSPRPFEQKNSPTPPLPFMPYLAGRRLWAADALHDRLAGRARLAVGQKTLALQLT